MSEAQAQHNEAMRKQEESYGTALVASFDSFPLTTLASLRCAELELRQRDVRFESEKSRFAAEESKFQNQLQEMQGQLQQLIQRYQLEEVERHSMCEQLQTKLNAAMGETHTQRMEAERLRQHMQQVRGGWVCGGACAFVLGESCFRTC